MEKPSVSDPYNFMGIAKTFDSSSSTKSKSLKKLGNQTHTFLHNKAKNTSSVERL